MGEIVLDSPPTRVVALEFSFVDALATLGVSPVGVADDGDASRVIEPIRTRLAEWTSLGARSQPSLEVIASLKPDLIIADIERHASVYEDLKRIAPTLILKRLPSMISGKTRCGRSWLRSETTTFRKLTRGCGH